MVIAGTLTGRQAGTAMRTRSCLLAFGKAQPRTTSSLAAGSLRHLPRPDEAHQFVGGCGAECARPFLVR
jgi:hypothetical protein